MKLKKIYESLLKEDKYQVYHGSNVKFTKFNLNNTAQNIAWFSDSIDDIRSGDSGADSTKYILKFEIQLNHPAGWNEYDKYSIDELINLGYDGVILPDNGITSYIVFDNDNIEYKGEVK